MSGLVTFFEPQAAASGEDLIENAYLSSNYIAQEKLDGARYLLHKYADGQVKVYSRRTSVVTHLPVDKTAQLAHIADSFDQNFPCGTVIDGEVVAPGSIKFKGRPQKTSSNLVTRVTGASPEKALAYQKEHGFLEFAAFDCLAFDGSVLTDLCLKYRMDRLETLALGSVPYLFFLPFTVGEDQKRRMYDKIVKRGGEGIILKDLNAPYYCGKRHASWVKVKKERTFDVVFLGIELAQETTTKKSGETSASRIRGLAGAIRFGQYVQTGLLSELTELGTVSGFDDETRLDITNNHVEYARRHRVFEVRAQEQFESGALRHPRFVGWRDDKSAEDCVLRKDEA